MTPGIPVTAGIPDDRRDRRYRPRRVDVPSIRLEESRGRAASEAASYGRNRLDSRTSARSPVSSTTRPARPA